jgi:hypothetical protein
MVDVGIYCVAILLVMIIAVFILIRIAYYIKNLKLNLPYETVTENTNISNVIDKNSKVKSNLYNNPKSMLNDLDSKWEKKTEVKSSVNNLGKEKVVDGSKSLDAVNLMRKMKISDGE